MYRLCIAVKSTKHSQNTSRNNKHICHCRYVQLTYRFKILDQVIEKRKDLSTADLMIMNRMSSANSAALNFTNLDKYRTPPKYSKFSNV